VNELEKLATGKVKLDVSFEEFNMVSHVSYNGTTPDFSMTRPTGEELLSELGAQSRLSGFLIHKYAQKIQAEEKDGLCHVWFYFEH